MGDQTKIEWTWVPGYTGASLNAITGCENESPGCTHCYSRDASSGPRLQQFEKYKGVAIRTPSRSKWTRVIKLHPDELARPLHQRNPRSFFVNSMSDTFHKDVPFSYIAAHFALAASTPRHLYIFLTKRAARLEAFFVWFNGEVEELVAHGLPIDEARSQVLRVCWDGWCDERLPIPAKVHWPLPNVWCGVSAESQKWLERRVDHLRNVPVVVRFISYEPGLGELDFKPEWLERNGRELHWLLVGGESGPKARYFDLEWARVALRRFSALGGKVFVKQMGEVWAKTTRSYKGDDYGSTFWQLGDHKGGDMRHWAEDLRVREYPVENAGGFDV